MTFKVGCSLLLCYMVFCDAWIGFSTFRGFSGVNKFTGSARPHIWNKEKETIFPKINVVIKSAFWITLFILIIKEECQCLQWAFPRSTRKVYCSQEFVSWTSISMWSNEWLKPILGNVGAFVCACKKWLFGTLGMRRERAVRNSSLYILEIEETCTPQESAEFTAQI